MRYLCVCQYGHSRSVALCRVLHSLGKAAVAAGWQTSGDALEMLSGWADVIFLLEGSYLQYLPPAQRHKAVVLDVGPDRWANPYNRELHNLLHALLKQQGYL